GFSGYIGSSQIKRININAGEGNDTVALDITAALATKVFAQGGGGRDALVFGSRARPMSYSGFEQYLDNSLQTSERYNVDSSFAGLKGEFEVDGGSTRTYNCIAWSLGITNKWIDPKKSLAEFDKLDGQYGYKRMSSLDFSLTPYYEKIVLYGKKDASGRIT